MINQVYESMTNGAPEPKAGMGATITFWTDRHAATVVAWDGAIVTVQRDSATRVDDNGMSDAQNYKYEPNENGHRTHFRKDKKGRWVRVVFNKKTGRWNKNEGPGLVIGFRNEYYDFSF